MAAMSPGCALAENAGTQESTAEAHLAADVGTAKPDATANIYDGSYLVIGLGITNVPLFEGSGRRGVHPGFGFLARYHGISINPRTAGAAFTVTALEEGQVAFSIGPVIRWRAGRSSNPNDPIVAKLDPIKGNLELGFNVGVKVKHVLNDYDSFGIGVDVRWDATTHTGSRIISVGPSYFTPVSKAQVIGISSSLDFVNAAWSDRNYGVSAAASATSGLPIYKAHAGLRGVGFRAFTAYDLSGDLRNGGFSVGAGVGYTILAGSAADSPIIKARGRHNAVQLAAGIGYAF